MNGKPVRSVLAKTPLEAWGKTLLSLGLIDEIMYTAALKALQSSREEGFNEVRDKIDAANKKRRDDRAREKLRLAGKLDGVDDRSNSDKEMMGVGNGDNGREDPSEMEVALRNKLADMQKKLAAAKKQSKAASFDLANARIATISPFAANPFLCRDESESKESSWLEAAIKKDKSKMGNTGNKRKIANPTTLMDKNDTFFFGSKVEKLVEGLPGTEFAPSYVFHANRGSASSNSQTWVHEAKIRHQKEQKKKQAKVKQAEEKAKKQAEAKAKIEEERVSYEEECVHFFVGNQILVLTLSLWKSQALKRKLQEEAVAERKRQKEEEEEKKKRDRIEKRLGLLNSQMDDRLFKEACTMREKNIMNFVRGLNKEFTRRRKAVETSVGSKILSSTQSLSNDTSSTVLAPFQEALPPLSRPYDAEVVRIWDFLHSFSDVLPKRTVSDTEALPPALPSLDSLQNAIDCLKDEGVEENQRLDAMKLFKGIAMDLCKVISPR